MTFMQALGTGLPMRRCRTLGEGPWPNLGIERLADGRDVPRWRCIDTGMTTGLFSWDYAADDWEVMPDRSRAGP